MAVQHNLTAEAFFNTLKLVIEESINGEVKISEITKNNGLKLTALVIKEEGQLLCPTIYLNPYYEMYIEGASLTEVIELFMNSYEDAKASNIEVDIDALKNWEEVRKNISFKLINSERNSGLLKEAPHVDFLDLSAVFNITVDTKDGGSGSILIKYELMNQWGVSEADLYEVATENFKNSGIVCKTMFEVLKEFDPPCTKEKINETLEEIENGIPPMFVLSNERSVNGASVLLFKEFFRELAEKFKDDIFILPSSIHEIIAVPTRAGDLENFSDMVSFVNETKVSEEEFLSNTVYLYSREEDCLKIAE